MQCPKCGYIQGELETECLRCKQATATTPTPERVRLTARSPLPAEMQEKECPRCGKATRGDAKICDKCGYEYQADSSRSERYQALLAEEARTAPPPSALRRTVPPALSWSIIGASLLAIGVAGWAMFGAAITGEDTDSLDSAPMTALRPHKPHHVALHTVTYQVAGTAASAIVTYHGPDGTTIAPPGSVSLPWTQAFKAKTGTPLSVSAKPSDAAGTVTVEIDVDGVPQKQAATSNADGVTTASNML